MSFWNFFKNKKKDNREPDDTSISDESSLDLIFAKNFTESGGRFIYLDHENSTKDVFEKIIGENNWEIDNVCSCLLYTSPSPRDKRQSRMPSSA